MRQILIFFEYLPVAVKLKIIITNQSLSSLPVAVTVANLRNKTFRLPYAFYSFEFFVQFKCHVPSRQNDIVCFNSEICNATLSQHCVRNASHILQLAVYFSCNSQCIVLTERAAAKMSVTRFLLQQRAIAVK